jgi:hypothetical protein
MGNVFKEKARRQVTHSVRYVRNASASIGKFWYNILHLALSRLQGICYN